MMAIRQWHWAVAFVIACALHLGLAVLMILETIDPPASGLGKGGMEIQLTRSGSRPAESAHTRNDVTEAAQRAAADAAPLVRADRAEKAVAPNTVANTAAPEVARDETRPDIVASPVPEDAEATAPASAPQPADLSDAQPLAAPVADTAAVPNQTAQEAAPEHVETSAAPVIRTVDDTQPTESITALPVETRAAEAEVTARPADTVSALPASPAASSAGAVPPPDALPPLEQVRDVAPANAASVAAAVTPDAAAAAIANPALPVEQAVRRPAEAAAAADIPLATATDPGAEEAAAAAPRVPDAPATGALPVTRTGEDVTNAGAVGPDETAKAVATGRNDEVSTRSGDGAGEDRRDALGGAGGDKSRYISQVKQWIQLHQEYPEAAREAGQEGVVLIFLKVGRDGQALEYRIMQSTGHPLLDAEIVLAVARSLPLPEIPDTVEQVPLKLILPFSFSLKD